MKEDESKKESNRPVHEVKAHIELSQSQSHLVIAGSSTLPAEPSAGCQNTSPGLVKPQSFIHYLIGCREPGSAGPGSVGVGCRFILGSPRQTCHKQCLHSVHLIVRRAIISVNQMPIMPACCDSCSLNAFTAWLQEKKKWKGKTSLTVNKLITTRQRVSSEPH